MATDTKREAVISSELANTIADYVESLGHTSLFTSVTDDGASGYVQIADPDPIIAPHAYEASTRWQDERYFGGRGAKCVHCACEPDNDVHKGGRPVYQVLHHVITRSGMFGTLPKFWTLDVSEVLAARGKAIYEQQLTAAIDAFTTTPAIAAFLREQRAAGTRGFRAPKAADLRYLVNLSQSARQYKPAYKPAPGCAAVLKLADAVEYAYSQEAYADYIRYAVPVVLANNADVAICQQNLHAFAEACRTHTGLAGSGSNYSATLHQTAAGAFVVIEQRASIAD
jgi:hypothetical protein